MARSRSIATVVSTKDGKRFSRALPDMPAAIQDHCQTTIDASFIMVFGGGASALKLDIRGKKWKRLPNMPRGRHGPVCGVVREKGLPKRAVVAGGWTHVIHSRRQPTNQVDILELSTLVWKRGHSLPQKLYYQVPIPFGDTFLAVGGTVDGRYGVATIYKYDLEFGRWKTLPYKVAGAVGSTMFSVRRQAFNGTQ